MTAALADVVRGTEDGWVSPLVYVGAAFAVASLACFAAFVLLSLREWWRR